MKALILAGGKGTRLQNHLLDIPKPLARVGGRPVLEHQILNMKRYGIVDIILIIGYLGEHIKAYFGDGSKLGVNISYFEETHPLGTAGALFYLKRNITGNFILTYGDLIFDINFNRLIDFHQQNNGYCTLTTHPNNHPFDSDLLIIRDQLVEGIIGKAQPRDQYYKNSVNAGVFIFNSKALEFIQADHKQDLEQDLIRTLVSLKKVYAYKTTEYIKDMGTPERYRAVLNDYNQSYVQKRNLSNKQKAVFLDRDGTINELVGLLTRPEQLKIDERIYEAIKLVNQSEFLCMVITNQPVIARNLCSVEELETIHSKLETLLGERGVYLDGIYYCPHHPDRGYFGENKEFKTDCDCRKPKTGLIKRAVNQYNIDLDNSYFIGDSTIDIQTGKNANLHTVQLATGQGGKDGKYNVEPDFYAADLLDAVKLVICAGGEGNGNFYGEYLRISKRVTTSN